MIRIKESSENTSVDTSIMYKRKDGYLRLVTLLVFRLVERIEKYAAGAEHLNRPLCVRMTYISNVLVQLLLHNV